jgi:hypothetical protein
MSVNSFGSGDSPEEQKMARGVTNRKALREAHDAAEARAAAEGDVKAEKKKKEPAKRTRAKKEPAEVRVKVQWAVFSQNLKKVATFDFNQEAQARKKAEELTQSSGNNHFVQKMKEPVTV